MAEETETSTQSGTLTGQPASTSPATNGDSTTANDTMVVLPPADDSQESTAQPTLRELEELRRVSERYKQQLDGQARERERLAQERDAIRAELDRYREVALRMQQPQTQPPPEPTPPPVSAADALNKYLEGDTTALEAWERSLRTPQQSQTDIDRRILDAVDKRLQSVQSQTELRQHIGSRHAELLDPNHSLYRQLYEQYDQVARSPMYRVMFPEDERFVMKSVPSPDGYGGKDMDLRIVNDYVMQLKLAQGQQQQQAATDEVRAQGTGAVEGTGTRTGTQSTSIEAANLLGTAVMSEIDNLMANNAIPPEWKKKVPQGASPLQAKRAIAKHVWDTSPDDFKRKKLEEYRKSSRGVA